MSSYVYNPGAGRLNFRDARDALAKRYSRVVSGSIDNVSAPRVARILELGRDAGINFDPFIIDIADYRRYVDDAGYASRYPDYYRGNQPEKSLEHWIALRLLNVRPTEIFIDVASENSPVPEIYWRLAGACSFSQDISYPAGVAGNRIGGDACAMPVPSSFAAKASLTCSLEHFEDDADIRLFSELSRVLKPGGSVCIVPFYLYEEDATQTDPVVSLSADVPFDEGTTIYCAENWGNRHARFYTPAKFKARIADRFANAFQFRYFQIVNASDVHPSVYARFALTATRPSL
jgi:SAM-dependent methyltransferase